jgi:hypothetical protein
MKSFELGKAYIEPDHPIEAGALVTIRYTYVAGHPIDDTGYVKIVFRHVGDFGAPQFSDPKALNYCSVSTTGDCRIEPRWDPKGHTRPWSRALFLKVVSGYLDRGEEIKVVFGDKNHSSPGWQVQTFCVDRFEFKTLVDPIATYQFKELDESPFLKIIPGKPVEAICIAPSIVEMGKPFSYFSKLEDRWGNPVKPPTRHAHNEYKAVGSQTISFSDKTSGLSAESNPVKVVDEVPKFKPYWADFHGQSEETVGTNPIEKYFQFGRDYAILDILGHQGNDFQVTDDFWKKVNKMTREYYEAGSFVTFPGYEYSANTPLGGDRNVYFTREGGRISRSSSEQLPDNFSEFEDSETAEDLFNNLAKQSEFNPFVFAHVGGRYADLKMHNAELEVAVEIHSAWGTFEWLLEDAFARGYRVGIVANSDGHKCRPGASYPGASKFGSYGGLTCVLADKLDRPSVYHAVKARRTVATTGNRPLIQLDLTFDDGRTAQIGEIIKIGEEIPQLQASILATAPIEEVQVRNGMETIGILRPYSEKDLGNRIKINWSGSEVRGRGRQVVWDGTLEVINNKILNAVPVNFWNPDHPLKQESENRITWRSITTGGTTGMILTLSEPFTGEINLHTLQKDIHISMADLGIDATVWDCGGLRKEIQAIRLPDKNDARSFSFSLPINALKMGDNPIYIRLTQEDGHMAWTSPIYLIKKK